MAHDIETFGTEAAFVTARTDAWHRLGTTLPDVFDADTAMRIAHLGEWNVHKTPLTTTIITPEGVSTLDVPDRFATVRTNPFTGTPDVLGVVGADYVPVQNEDHTDLLNALVDESGAHFETAGSLRGGRQVFVTMKLPQTMRIGGVDDIDLYIAALNSHDGSTAFRLLVTPVRVVCANTQTLAIAHARQSFSLRHTSGISGKITEARQALGLTWEFVEAFEVEAERMIQTAMSERQYMDVVRKVIPAPTCATARQDRAYERTLGELRALWHAPTQAGVAGTRWAGWQAVVEWVDHVAPVRVKGDKDAARAVRTLTGGWAADRKQAAFDLLRV